jgi:hypothetical protein
MTASRNFLARRMRWLLGNMRKTYYISVGEPEGTDFM